MRPLLLLVFAYLVLVVWQLNGQVANTADAFHGGLKIAGTVPYDQLRTGDILYFAEDTLGQIIIRYMERGYIGHVGLVIADRDGSRYVIEALAEASVPDVLAGKNLTTSSVAVTSHSGGVRVHELRGRVASCLHSVAVRQLVFKEGVSAETAAKIRRDIRAAALALYRLPYHHALLYWAYLTWAPSSWIWTAAEAQRQEAAALTSASSKSGLPPAATYVNMWCSWLVAEVYKRAGLLKPVYVANDDGQERTTIPRAFTPKSVESCLPAALNTDIADLSAPKYISIGRPPPPAPRTTTVTSSSRRGESVKFQMNTAATPTTTTETDLSPPLYNPYSDVRLYTKSTFRVCACGALLLAIGGVVGATESFG